MRRLGQDTSFDALIKDELDEVSANENRHTYNIGNPTMNSTKTDIEGTVKKTDSEQAILPAPLYSKKKTSNDVDA